MRKILNHSFISLTRQTIGLLSEKQQVRALKNISFSLILALLEVISLGIAIPVFYHLINTPDDKIALPVDIAEISLSWSAVVCVLIMVFLIKNAIAIWLTHKQHHFANNLYTTYAEALYKRFYNQPYTEYLQQNSVETFRKIKNTAFDFTNNVLLNYFLISADLLICMLVTGILIWLDFRVIFILIALSLPVIVFYYYFRKKVISNLDRSFRDLTPQASITLSQGIDSFAEARIYHKENFFIDRFIDISKITTRLLSHLKIMSSLPLRIFETLAIISFSAIIVYGRFFSIDNESLLIFLGLIAISLYRIIPSLNRILVSLSQIQSYAYSVSELSGLLNSEKTLNTLVHEQQLSFDKTIELKGVSFHFLNDKKDLLRKINVKIRKGEFVVLEGPSGAGKTTVLNLISGLITDYSGEILIDETILSPSYIHAWQSKLGFVQQTPVILQDSLLHNITFGEDTRLIDFAKVKKVTTLVELDEFINSTPLQLDTPVSENGLTLSGGQRQRLALARALYRDPEVLLLDEAVNQLDEKNKICVLKRLKLLCADGKTIILASHDAASRQFADRILRLEYNTIHETISADT